MSSKSKLANPELVARSTAETLREVYAFLESRADMEDFLRGYSLSSAVQERLDFIGEPLAPSALQELAEEVGNKAGTGFTERGVPTLEAELLVLEQAGLQAIDQAIALVTTPSAPGQDATKDAEAIIDGVDAFKVED